MRRIVVVLFVLAVTWMAGDHPAAVQPGAAGPCPPKWRKDPDAAARAREIKKRRMRENGVPERYLHLLDKMECVACIETAPDTLHITVLYNDDEHAPTLSTGQRDLKVEFRWNAQSERQLREELRNGQIQAFYVWIHEKRCYCCPDDDQIAEDAQDWNDDTELNMDEAEAYDDVDDLGPLPDDLKPPPPGSQLPPPPIERFDDLPRPGRRVLQATCQPCEGLARQWTNESNNLNFLWDRKIEQMRRVSVIANARANRYNEIERLEYEQRFDSTRSYANLQKIKELKEINEAQESDQDKAEQEIEGLDRQIRETEMRMEELMQKFLECEKTCKKTTTADTSVVNTTPPAMADAPPAVAAAPTPPSTPQGSPAAQAVAACPDCSAAAQRIADLQKSIAEHEAEIKRLQDAIDRNTANIDNLTQMRRDAAAEGNRARVAELEGRISDLQNSNRGHRGEQFRHREEVTALGEQIAAAQRDLEACNSQCAAKGLVPRSSTAGTPGGGTGLRRPDRTIAVDPLPPLPACKECESLVQQLRAEHEQLVKMAQRANDLQIDADIDAAEDQRAKVEALKKELEKCTCPTTTTQATANTTGPAVADHAGTGTTCMGADCSDEWAACSATNSCAPIDRDCGVPGTCSSGSDRDLSTFNLLDPSAWSASANADVETRIQIKIGDVVFDEVVQPYQAPRVENWFNPLGLLARQVTANFERWRGGAGPRALLDPRDLKLVERFTGAQNAGLPKGLHVLLTDRGGSTGRTLGMQVLNLTGQPVRLGAMPFALEPIKQQAQQRAQQAFSRLAKAAPVNIDLAGYCVEFLKLPPSANQIFRLAPASVQKKYEAMSKVLRSAFRVQQAGLLKPDSAPAAYTDSIKQWAIWTVEQRFNESRFTDAFIGHTRKNLEAAGQQWPKQAEEMIRKAAPNRWRDIVKIVSGAGLPAPQ